MLAQMKQAGAVGTLGGAAGALLFGGPAGAVGGAVTALALPAVLSRAITSPRLYRYLTEGFQYSGLPKGNAAINRLMQEIGEEEAQREKEKPEPEYRAPWEAGE